ncbi:putative membrane protein [Acetobacter sp. CAG:267]|nr:putative membrane protein [Acetobacter sp. CAG:267]
MKKKELVIYRKWRKDSKKNLRSVKENVNDYIISYGGYFSILTSSYFLLAFLLNCLMVSSWISIEWIGNVKSIVPSIIGLSLSAYAILVAFGSEVFQKFISQKLDGEKDINNTMYKQINTAFIHFIVTQMFSLILALLGDTILANPFNFFEIFISFFCNLIFIYSLMLGLAAVFTIFRVAKLYQEFNNSNLN